MDLAIVESMDDLVREGLYPNRAELIRLAVKDLLLKHGSFSFR
jgi:Arc/MetJ-type ribon-helix-helix transcriptional regulator